jgi:diguanylate cyclase (GGDEF)-like protein/PAS domain S-box-containing protein
MSVVPFWLSIYSAIALSLLALIIFSIRNRKKVQAARSFAYLVFSISISVGGQIAGRLMLDQKVQLPTYSWLYLSVSGLILTSPALVIFTLNHLRSRGLTQRKTRLLLHLPAFILIPLTFTNSIHKLVWKPTISFNHPGFFGPAYYIILLISTLFTGYVLALLLDAYGKVERVYHVQYGLFITGILFPLSIYIYVHVYNPPIAQLLDLTITSCTLMLLIFAFAIFRLPLVGVLPIAQSELLRHIRDGFLVTNLHQEIIFINPAAQEALGISEDNALGKPLSALISEKTKKIIINMEMEHTSFELQVGSKYYHVNISNIKNKRQHKIGQIVIIYDVTAQTEFSNQFREQANKDELTNVFNRRYLLKEAGIEFERAKRYHLPLSIIMLDLDNLKRINDQYGHITGDAAIQAFSATCQNALRSSDTIGRFGGDEFVVILPHTGAEKAISIVKRLEAELEKTQIDTDQGPLRLSASFGVTSLNENTDASFEEMIKRADKALYLAKNNPKSCYAEAPASNPSTQPRALEG